jgi:hypothetical protein
VGGAERSAEWLPVALLRAVEEGDGVATPLALPPSVAEEEDEAVEEAVPAPGSARESDGGRDFECVGEGAGERERLEEAEGEAVSREVPVPSLAAEIVGAAMVFVGVGWGEAVPVDRSPEPEPVAEGLGVAEGQPDALSSALARPVGVAGVGEPEAQAGVGLCTSL